MFAYVCYKAMGNLLFQEVCKMLNLLEVDYFGLEYADSSDTKYWLDYSKPMCQQLGLSLVNPVMYFRVKFYTPDPARLQEEYTRYLFSLQIKQDLAEGALQCNDNTAALIASYIVQADCGDYNVEEYPDHTYLSSFKFVPYQNDELERKIMENHKKHVGQSPSEADINLLETARRCELYGIKMTPAKDLDGVHLNLAVAHLGILVFQRSTKITTFSWAKIRKLSFKRKKLMIKLHPEESGIYRDVVEFFFEERNSCKNFWKKGVETHAFFRCSDSLKLPRKRSRILSRGSSFRYRGRTQKEIAEFVHENCIRRRPFQRSSSFRIQSTSHGSVGSSVSEHPLLSVSSDQSYGSVVLDDSRPVFAASESKCTSDSQASSPVTTQEPNQMTINGLLYNKAEEKPSRKMGFSTGLRSSNLEYDKVDLYSPDAFDHNADDNISHDSYHLDEHVVNEDTSREHTYKDNVRYTSVNNTGYGSEDNLVKDDVFCSEDDNIKSNFEYSLEVSSDSYKKVEGKAAVPQNDGPIEIGNIFPGNDTNVYKAGATERENNNNVEISYLQHGYYLPAENAQHKVEKPQQSNLKLKNEHDDIQYASPKLYTHAHKSSSSSSSSSSNNSDDSPRSIDVVCNNQLLAVGNISSQDDSVDGELLGEILKNMRNKSNLSDSPEVNREEVDVHLKTKNENVTTVNETPYQENVETVFNDSDLMTYHLDRNPWKEPDLSVDRLKSDALETEVHASNIKSSTSPAGMFDGKFYKNQLNLTEDLLKDESYKSSKTEKDTFSLELEHSTKSIEMPPKCPFGQGDVLSGAPTHSIESTSAMIEATQPEFDKGIGILEKADDKELCMKNDSNHDKADTSSQDDESTSDTSSTGEAVQSTHSSCSEKSLHLSDSRFQEINLFLSEEDLNFEDGDSKSEDHYVESVFLEINQHRKELVQPPVFSTHDNNTSSCTSSAENSSVENMSLHEDMEILEDIIGKTEIIFDEDEIAQNAEGFYSCSSPHLGQNAHATPRHRTCLEVEVTNGKISEFSACSEGRVSQRSC
ncbi:uncharacterized protein LOC143232587 isoform X2 [Tachypleus tridentatus]|uniref:uncharacterized protein LOC143232587 isoform X2 n=1 Tax=Tachypleus tridentatus TaxID=6853 RepID=UPI003FD5F19E